jgi:hypothetical protein
MIRRAALFCALIVAAEPAFPATYSATLAVPVAARFIARDITWACGAQACSGATDESRPLVICQSLAKRAGRIEAFLVDGRALGAPELERCNASAKTDTREAVARK